MANIVFNIAKGRVNGYHNRVANDVEANSGLVVVLLKAVESDAVLQDYDSLSAILAAAGNTEADFTDGATPYARKILTDVDISAATPDDATDNQSADIPDQVWADAGGSVDNSLVKMLICYDPDTLAGDDTSIIPLCAYDFVANTNGNSLTAVINSSGYFSAS